MRFDFENIADGKPRVAEASRLSFNGDQRQDASATFRFALRRVARGLDPLRNRYLDAVDEWAIYKGSEAPASLLDTGDHRPTAHPMEDATDDRAERTPPRPVKPLDDPDFIGAEVALHRASGPGLGECQPDAVEPKP